MCVYVSVCVQVHVEDYAYVCIPAVYILVLLNIFRFCYVLALLNEANISQHKSLTSNY